MKLFFRNLPVIIYLHCRVNGFGVTNIDLPGFLCHYEPRYNNSVQFFIFIFMQFSAKIMPNGSRPLWSWLLRPRKSKPAHKQEPNYLNCITSGGSKGGAHPTDQNFLNFMQFLGKSGKFVCWRPLLEGWRPLLRGILDPPLITI